RPLPVRPARRRRRIRGLMSGDDPAMDDGGLRGDAVLHLPVRARGIELGRPMDIVLDLAGGRAVGIEVFCGDKRRRFLPLAAAGKLRAYVVKSGGDEVVVPLDDDPVIAAA